MERRLCFIYKITNLKNGKIYIGRTFSKIQKRFREHFIDSKYPLNNCPLHLDMKLYEKEDFKIEQVCEVFVDNFRQADQIELENIIMHNSFVPNGYNVRRVKCRKENTTI